MAAVEITKKDLIPQLSIPDLHEEMKKLTFSGGIWDCIAGYLFQEQVNQWLEIRFGLVRGLK